MTNARIDFWFDFSSPYGYLAATRIEEVAARHGRGVRWRPMLLGAVFKVSGQTPLLDIPLKGAYSRHDMARFARLWNVKLAFPPAFPFSAVASSRVFYWLAGRDEALAARSARAAYDAAWAEGGDISKPDAAAAVAATLGVERAATLAALADPAVKEKLRLEVDEAVAQGVFGSPTIVVDGEKFWGADRLWQVEEWLQRGGW
jgi:2-hydroxychromene-2-carboxylate isomerase